MQTGKMQENNTFIILAYEKEIQTTIKNEEKRYFSHRNLEYSSTRHNYLTP